MRYDYQPFVVVTNWVDDGSLDPNKARLETEEIMGETVAKTRRAIYTNAEAGKVEIEEQCLAPDAAFGDASNLRSVKVYYPPSTNAGSESGRIRTVTRPDGRMENHRYERGDYAAGIFTVGTGDYERVTVFLGTAASSNGIAGKTTAAKTINDPLGRTVRDETSVYTGAGYERISWTTYAYDNFSRIIRTDKSDGTYTETTWGCCGKESEKDENGIEYVYTYDALQRLTLKMKQGIPQGEYPAQPDQYTIYTLDAADRVITERITAPGLSQIRTNQYDMVGRLTNFTDFAGLSTKTAYSQDGLTAVETLPGGFTRITERYKDGQVKSITGTAQIGEHYEYGVNVDGTKWTIAYTGPNGTNSPVWVKTTSDLLSRAIREERPGFSVSSVPSVVTNLYSYNSKGYLRSSAFIGGSISLTTLYEYDDLGNQIRSGLDINNNGQLDHAGPDRITESETFYAKSGADWWSISANKIYAADNSSTPTTNSIQKNRLTGLSAGKTSETISEDILGNQTISVSSVVKSEKKVIQNTVYPDSTNPAVSVTLNGLLVSATSKTGVKTTFAYDPMGRRCSSRSVSGTEGARSVASVTAYNSKGQVAYTEDAASNRTTFAYDPATGRKLSQTDPLTNTTYFAWSPEGLLLATWGSAVYPVAYEYDAFNRMSAMYTYRGTNSISSYFDICNLKFAMDRTTWSFDPATGLLTNKLYADGKGVSYSYTPDGKLASRIWSRTPNTQHLTTLYSYDLSSALTNIDYSDTTPDIAFTYDRLGRQTQVVQGDTGIPACVIHTFTYSPTTLLLTNETKVTQAFLPVTNTIFRSYDALGRSSGLAVGPPLAGAPYSIQYGFDPLGRFSSVSSSVQSASSVVNYSYLPNSDLISTLTASPFPLTASRSYESNRDLITQIKNTVDSTIISQYDYANDAGGRRMSVRYSGSAFEDGASFNLYGYNTRSEVVGADRYWGNDMNDTNNPVLAQGFGYEYDPIGNRKTTSHLCGLASLRENYTANNLNQYTERTVPGKFPVLGSASEDAYVTVSLTNGAPSPVDRQGKYWHKALEVDNTSAAAYPEIKVVGVYNPQSAGIPDIVSEEVGRKFVPKTPEQFTYDADGNMLSDGRFTYTWDAENRLISVEGKSGAGVPPASLVKAVYAYDYMGRRISKKLYRRQGQDWSSTPYKEIVYIYDGWNMICESIRETKSAGGGGGGGGKGKGQGQQGQGGGGGGSVSISTNYYVWGLDLSGSIQGAGGIGGLLMILPSSGGAGGGSTNSLQPSAYYPLHDANGNVSEYVTTNGALAAHYEYSPFGETIVSTGSKKDAVPFRFSTKYFDQETGLYYYGYRFYSPQLGRWLSRDPVGTRGGLNVYVFVMNGPLHRIDPRGLDVTSRTVKYNGQAGVRWHGSVEIKKHDSGGNKVQVHQPVNSTEPGNYSGKGGSIDGYYQDTVSAYVGGTTSVREYNDSWVARGKGSGEWAQMSADISGDLEVCGCCQSGKLKVEWEANADLYASGSYQQGASVKVEWGSDSSREKIIKPGDPYYDKSGSYTLDITKGGSECINVHFGVWLSWDADEDLTGSGMDGYGLVSLVVDCQ